ncbi:hypothetical protein NP493_8203g00001 [Ridgeia piscesae]|uniref:Uncharacterized protein n=1 Tax=Ridgeia piscesae TaxID=27915 RepID=A0AAD9MMP1_RIDPI|nr:hypothetical protein NP493_8203g00001 [Ridgeia piscesae]
MGKLSGTESISTRSSGDFTTTKSISQFPVTKKKDRKLTRESTDTTLSRRSSLPPVESPGRTYIRGSDTSTTEYRLHSQELYMGRNSFPVFVLRIFPFQLAHGFCLKGKPNWPMVCKTPFNWPMVCKIRFNWPMVFKTPFDWPMVFVLRIFPVGPMVF